MGSEEEERKRVHKLLGGLDVWGLGVTVSPSTPAGSMSLPHFLNFKVLKNKLFSLIPFSDSILNSL